MPERTLTGKIRREIPFSGTVNKGVGMGALPEAGGLSRFPSPAYSVNGVDLTNLQTAIAEKSGVEVPAFPDGFVEAVDKISGFSDGNLIFKEYIVTVAEDNGVTNGSNLMTYFQSRTGAACIFAFSLCGLADTYNQPIFGAGGTTPIVFRYRNGYVSVPTMWNNIAYDAALVPGTNYKVYSAERIV